MLPDYFITTKRRVTLATLNLQPRENYGATSGGGGRAGQEVGWCQSANTRFGIGSPISVTRKKSPNVYKSCPKMISIEKMIDFDKFTKIA